MRARFIAALALCATACHGVPSPTGIEEPVRVRNAMFVRGELPGTAPGATSEALQVTAIETASGTVTPRQLGRSISGRTTADASAIAVRFADEAMGTALGGGYWLAPVGGPDPTANGELVWQLTMDFGSDLPVGLRALRFVALDAQGRGGVQRDARVCLLPAVPDNLNACDATIAPPAAVLSLSWDVDADVNLVVVTPEGKVVDGDHPTTALGPNGGTVTAEQLASEHTGRLDRDSNANCEVDGARRESLVFQGSPPAGTYRVYAQLFNACGFASVRARFELFVREELPSGGGYRVARRGDSSDAQLTQLAANGGRDRGLFVTEVTFP